ncbi:MAG: hypothetical protein JOZ08_08350 [Verrucomicrobia bacterium]|nr:hypothetical protein [Verrucomicrobiota bacterium]
MKTHEQIFLAASATQSEPRPGARHRLLYIKLLILALSTNWNVSQGAVPILGRLFPGISGKMDKQAELLVEVQDSLLRFADEYSMRMVGGVDDLRRGAGALSPAEVLRLKIAIDGEIWSIASGPNAVADLIDMTVFVTVMRMTLEDYWQPKVFGKSALPMLAYSRSAEADIWKLAGKVLKPEQQTDLLQSIAAWHHQNPLGKSLVALRSLDFASRVEALGQNEVRKPGSVFSLLNIDPLAGMEPAVREVAQTRMFGERVLFVTQKMPTLLRWETELLSVNAVEMPAVQQLISNSTQLSVSVERFAFVAEKLPGQLSNEREEIVKALQTQEKDIASLMEQGTQFSTSLNTTLTTFDALMKRFGVGEPKSEEPPPNATPFRIQDYTESAAQIEATAGRLTEFMGMLDRTMSSSKLDQFSAQVGEVVQQAQAGGKEVVDYAFSKAILLVVAVLVAALIYRFLVTRLLLPVKNKN